MNTPLVTASFEPPRALRPASGLSASEPLRERDSSVDSPCGPDLLDLRALDGREPTDGAHVAPLVAHRGATLGADGALATRRCLLRALLRRGGRLAGLGHDRASDQCERRQC